MVGKLDTKVLDKTAESIPNYRVTATVETRDQKHQKDQEERKEEDEYSSSGRVKGWQKYHTDAKDRKAVKLRRSDIVKLFFRQVVLQRGLVIIEADIQLVNGQVLEGSHLFSTRIDTYWKLKKLSGGREIPLEQLIEGDYAEVSIVQQGGGTKITHTKMPIAKGARPGRPVPANSWSLWPLIDEKTRRINWVAITIYIIVAVSIFVTFLTIW